MRSSSFHEKLLNTSLTEVVAKHILLTYVPVIIFQILLSRYDLHIAIYLKIVVKL